MKPATSANTLAMKAAHETADAMAKALGQQIGKAQMIDEVPEYSYGSLGMLANFIAGILPSKSTRDEVSTAAGQQSVSASVVVSFELM